MKSTYISSVSLPAVRLTSGGRKDPVFLTMKDILMHYHRFIVSIKFYPLHHSESFHPLLLLFLFDWLMKRREITKEVLISSTYYVTEIAKCTWIWLSVSQPLILTSAMLISPCSDWNHKLQAMVISCLDLSIFLGYYVKSFSPCICQFKSWTTRYVHCFVIDVYILSYNLLLCVDIIVN